MRSFLGYSCVVFCVLSSIIAVAYYWLGKTPGGFTSPFVYFCLAYVLLKEKES